MQFDECDIPTIMLILIGIGMGILVAMSFHDWLKEEQ